MLMMLVTAGLGVGIAMGYTNDPPATYGELMVIRICGSLTILSALIQVFTLLGREPK